MNAEQWLGLLGQQLKETPFIQWLALGFGVSEVLLAKANKIWLYPTGIAATVLSVWILYQAGLYAECMLNGYYIVMSIYGWWYWVKKKHLPPVKATYSTRSDWKITLLIVLIGFALLSFVNILIKSTVPFWDAWVSATAWAGMWLLSRRKIENWVLLNISNAFAVPLLFHKQLPLYALLTIYLFIVAVQGYYQWAKIIKQENNSATLAV